jgi:hypothetical protein
MRNLPDASTYITDHIAGLTGWRREMVTEIRHLIHETEPAIVEVLKQAGSSFPANPANFKDYKWRYIPAWSYNGLVCSCETFLTRVIMLWFPRGALLDDLYPFLNSRRDGPGSTLRCLPIREGEKLDVHAFKDLIRAAVAENRAVPPQED